MSDHSNRPNDLDILGRDPSLASLAWQGWQLDGLPTTSVALAFTAAVLTTMLALGPLATVPLIAATFVGLTLAASASMLRDVAAARATLQVTRAALLAWLLLSAVQL